MRTLALLLLASLFTAGCHHNKPAVQPTQPAAQPAPVHGPPP